MWPSSLVRAERKHSAAHKHVYIRQGRGENNTSDCLVITVQGYYWEKEEEEEENSIAQTLWTPIMSYKIVIPPPVLPHTALVSNVNLECSSHE